MKEKNEKKAAKIVIPPELVARAKAGDQSAMAELYEQTNISLYRSVRSMVHDEDLAWDILQDSYLRAFQSLEKLSSDEAFLSWLRRIAVNETARQMSKRLPAVFSSLGGEENERLPELPDLKEENQPELALDRQETSRLVREILAELPEQQQLIVGMRYYEDLSVKEIAELLQLSPGCVKAQLFHGRKKVETRVRALEKQGVKLYSLGPVSFLMALLRRLEPAEEAGKKARAAMLDQLPGTAAGGAAVTTVTAMTAGQVFLHGLAGKLMAGVLAVALVGGLWAGGSLLFKEPARYEIGDVQPTSAQEVSVSEDTEQTAEPKLHNVVTEPEEGEVTEPAPSQEDVTEPLGPEPPEDPPTLLLPAQPSPPENPGGAARPDPSNTPDPSERAPEPDPSDTPDPSEQPPEPDPSDTPDPSEQPPEQEHDIVQSGACGPDTSWTLSADGVLTISGRGAMGDTDDTEEDLTYSYYAGSDVPSQARELVVEEGVTALGANAFCNLGKLETVSLPGTLTVIGRRTFDGCGSLNSIRLPNSVSSIGDSAFRGCTGLTNITIPGGVHTIEGFSFYGCAGLNSVTIPESVSAIGNFAFSGCTGLTSATIPESVSAIGNFAFSDCTGLRSVTISEGVSSIGDHAFSGCTGLNSVTIPESVSAIGISTFSGCTGLTSVTIPVSVTEIGEDAFDGCPDLTIYGYAESAAEAYAEEHGIAFAVIEPQRTGDAGPSASLRFAQDDGSGPGTKKTTRTRTTLYAPWRIKGRSGSVQAAGGRKRYAGGFRWRTMCAATVSGAS